MPAGDSPVFILTASRSGSTLLRVILDSHPRLACPPETSITSACMQLAMTCDVLENAAAALPDGDSEELPPVIRAALRAAVDRAYGHYLAERGKQRPVGIQRREVLVRVHRAIMSAALGRRLKIRARLPLPGVGVPEADEVRADLADGGAIAADHEP